MKEIPDNSIDYVFSYDAFCHVSYEGIQEYAENMYWKMKSGAVAFWMVADYEKYNRFDYLLKSSGVNLGELVMARLNKLEKASN